MMRPFASWMRWNRIEEVGPIPGVYLDKDHTRKWWKKEFFLPKITDRLPYSEWIKKGRKTAVDNAKERVKEIISTHKPMPLSEEQDREMGEILKEARDCYSERGFV